MCEQREKRLDEDDLITEFQKTIEVVKKEKETAAKKQKVVEQGLAAIQQEITEFQREKQVREGTVGGRRGGGRGGGLQGDTRGHRGRCVRGGGGGRRGAFRGVHSRRSWSSRGRSRCVGGCGWERSRSVRGGAQQEITELQREKQVREWGGRG